MGPTLGLTLWKGRAPSGRAGRQRRAALCDYVLPNKEMRNLVKGEEMLPRAMTSELGLEE